MNQYRAKEQALLGILEEQLGLFLNQTMNGRAHVDTKHCSKKPSSGNVLDGHIPPKQLKLIQAWIEIHKEELMVNWELAVNGEAPFRIAPLQ